MNSCIVPGTGPDVEDNIIRQINIAIVCTGKVRVSIRHKRLTTLYLESEKRNTEPG